MFGIPWRQTPYNRLASCKPKRLNLLQAVRSNESYLYMRIIYSMRLVGTDKFGEHDGRCRNGTILLHRTTKVHLLYCTLACLQLRITRLWYRLVRAVRCQYGGACKAAAKAERAKRCVVSSSEELT